MARAQVEISQDPEMGSDHCKDTLLTEIYEMKQRVEQARLKSRTQYLDDLERCWRVEEDRMVQAVENEMRIQEQTVKQYEQIAADVKHNLKMMISERDGLLKRTEKLIKDLEIADRAREDAEEGLERHKKYPSYQLISHPLLEDLDHRTMSLYSILKPLVGPWWTEEDTFEITVEHNRGKNVNVRIHK